MKLDKDLELRKKNEFKKNLKLNQEQKNVIVGTLMGDAMLSRVIGLGSCFIKFEQSIKNRIYVEHLHKLFEDWCGVGIKIRLIKGGGARDRESIYFQTLKHSSFLFYYNQFYKEKNGVRRKVVPDLLYKWLNGEVLAYWYMDDGSKTLSGYTLNTQGFTYEEHRKLVKILSKKFGFQVSIQKDRDKYKLYIGAKSKDSFLRLVEPYILENFKYKL